MTAKEFMRRPEIDYATATQFVGPAAEDLDAKVIELLETEIKYEGYINKALDQVAKMKRMEEKKIPEILIGMLLILLQLRLVKNLRK